jgi:hypothetical protein
VKCLSTAAEEIAEFELFVGNIPTNVAALDIYEETVLASLPEMQTFIDLVRSPAAKTPPSSLVAGALSDELTALIGDFRFGELSEDDLRAALDELDSRYQEELDIELGG